MKGAIVIRVQFVDSGLQLVNATSGNAAFGLCLSARSALFGGPA